MNSFVDPRPQPDEQLDAVAHEARRHLLVALVDETSQGGTPIKITEWLNNSTLSTSVTAMQHTHLPKLEDRGFIRWDREHHLVTQGPQFAEIEPLLAVLHEHRNELPDEWL